ncbi:MAG: hypothetical protein RLZZ543_847 [Bacteroidota bacterium]|jgi:hypothetical protein
MQHRGELLEAAIRKSGIPITRIVNQLKHSRRWLYNQFSRPDVSIDVMLDIGKIIHHNFAQELLELKQDRRINGISKEDDGVGYGEQSAQFWKDKYMRLLEEYNELLKSLK